MHRFMLFASVALSLVVAACAERKLPDSFRIDLQTLDGVRFKLADYAEQPMLLIFWTADCAPCAELSKRAQAAVAAEQSGVVFLVFVEPEPEADVIREAAAKLGMAGAIIADPDLRLVQALEIESHPALLRITPEADAVRLQREYDMNSGAIDRLLGAD